MPSNPYDFVGLFGGHNPYGGFLGQPSTMGGHNPYGGFLSQMLRRRQQGDQETYAQAMTKLRAAVAALASQGALSLPPQTAAARRQDAVPESAIAPAELYAPSTYFDRLGGVESSNDYTVVNPASGAGGKYQFIPGTWRSLMARPELNLTEEGRTSNTEEGRAQQERAVRALTKENVAALKETLGRAPTHTETYLAHFLGPGYASSVLRNPDTAVETLVPASFVKANPFLAGITGQMLLKMFARKFS